MGFAELQDGHNSECHVPHEVHSDGVKLITTCSAEPLRLTLDHLVFTPRGLVAAKELKQGDVVYGDEQEKTLCSIKEVQPEMGQQYFGLNCRDSVVMVSGVKTSTFGLYHTVPSLWMKWVSGVIGVQRASKLGDSIVSQLQRWNLL